MIQPYEKSQASDPLKQVTTNRLNSLIPCRRSRGLLFKALDQLSHSFSSLFVILLHLEQRIRMEGLKVIHHIAIICTDYKRSKAFYTGVLGLTIKQEIYREERESYKLDLCLGQKYIIELFSFPNPPPRPST